ncbi:MAG: type II toxin-antitoxin system RelE/ParE family toxin [Pseudobutyrivibrio sp.]|nr:type II toxin-antitoxin system RelE/ParE family toxin [Pseudobutyrivibrio sp.]
MDFKIVFYEKENGETPVIDFLDSCEVSMRAKISGTISILQEKGNLTRGTYSKHLEDGIFELRAIQGSNISRVLYFFYHGGRIVLTNGFIKKTQKTPRKEIELAKKYRADFIERYGECNENI